MSSAPPSATPNAFSFPFSTYPSPPDSDLASDKDCAAANDFLFDIESFIPGNQGANDLFDSFDLGLNTADLSGSPSTTPTSVSVISPKSSFSDFHLSTSTAEPGSAAEALSKHHLQRYQFYRALAEAAEADARAAQQQSEQFNALLASFGNNDMASAHTQQHLDPSMADKFLAAYQASMAKPAVVAAPVQPMAAPAMSAYDSYQVPLDMSMPAAFPGAQSFAPVPRATSFSSLASAGSMPMAYNIDAYQATQFWSRQSMSSGGSPPLPTTPVYSDSVPLGSHAMVNIGTSNSLPASFNSLPLVPMSMAPTMPLEAAKEGEAELSPSEDMSDSSSEHGYAAPTSAQSAPGSAGGMIPNLNGGGRGYIPGKTPDDPKKRHKCSVCGRGFARAFNLKSHVQTHNLVRSKPHVCPHADCKRGFSRLHDLERHRQGIHADGPLVDSKSLSPAASTSAAARAKSHASAHASVAGNVRRVSEVSSTSLLARQDPSASASATVSSSSTSGRRPE